MHPVENIQVFRHLGKTSGHGADGAGAETVVAESGAFEDEAETALVIGAAGAEVGATQRVQIVEVLVIKNVDGL